MTSVRTPPLLEARLAELGVRATVETRHVEPDALPGFVAAMRGDETLVGLLITMPHKAAILPFLNVLDPLAACIGSVNAVKRMANGGLVGAQFDGLALVRALKARGVAVKGRSIALLGTGGAGAAIAHAFAAEWPAKLDLFDLDQERAKRVAGMVHDHLGPSVVQLGKDFSEVYDIFVNATPLGMADGDPSPVPAELVTSETVVADIVADPRETALSAIADGAGATLITGRDMVVAQIGPIADWLLSTAVHPHGDKTSTHWRNNVTERPEGHRGGSTQG